MTSFFIGYILIGIFVATAVAYMACRGDKVRYFLTTLAIWPIIVLALLIEIAEDNKYEKGSM
jgi:hypothetical protein